MIRTRSLTKDVAVSKSNTVHAVRGISLDIEPGEPVAVLGPNGAGKTTTMRMLTTLIAPTSGSASVAGHDVVGESAQVRRLIGYVGQGNGAGHNQRAGDELISQGVIYGLDRRSARRLAAELLDALDLTVLASRKVSSVVAVPGRAVDRARPAEPRQPVGAHRGGERPDDDHADHPLPRRGRFDGRPGGGRGPRRGHCRRHRGGAQGGPGR